MSIMAHLILLVISYNSESDSDIKLKFIEYFLTGCLVASFCRDRFLQLIQKLFAFYLLNITCWSIKKQRKRISLPTIILNFTLFFPFILAMIILSCLISAPLLALFTFPFFIIGCPRNKKFWPQKNNFFSLTNSPKKTTTNDKSDSCFYNQLESKLLESFKELILSGSIGSSIQPDTYFLSRFQDRIIWIQILESSNTYCILNIKGLELQETSCHTREAQYIDDSFDLAFENPFGANANSQKHKKFLKFNPNPLNCMQQRDVLIFEAYSDAKNSLIGILDNPECLKLISLFFPKVLSYFLVKHLIRNNLIESENRNNKEFNLNIPDVFSNPKSKSATNSYREKEEVYQKNKEKENIIQSFKNEAYSSEKFDNDEENADNVDNNDNDNADNARYDDIKVCTESLVCGSFSTMFMYL